MTPDTLSGGAVAVLAAIADAQPTTIRAVCARVGMSLNGVVWHLRRLREAGLVAQEPRKARTLRLACRISRE